MAPVSNRRTHGERCRMPIETEAKFKVESHQPVRDRLRALGADFLGSVIETNRIFDGPGGVLQRQGVGLRIRETVTPDGEPGPSRLTFKGAVTPGPLKSREELEVTISDAGMLADILERLRYTPILTYQKRRESWRLGDCLVELDEPPHIGLFVEIEGPTVDAIRKVQTELGLTDAAHVASSYVRMLYQYCEDHSIPNRTLNLT